MTIACLAPNSRCERNLRIFTRVQEEGLCLAACMPLDAKASERIIKHLRCGTGKVYREHSWITLAKHRRNKLLALAGISFHYSFKLISWHFTV